MKKRPGNPKENEGEYQGILETVVRDLLESRPEAPQQERKETSTAGSQTPRQRKNRVGEAIKEATAAAVKAAPAAMSGAWEATNRDEPFTALGTVLKAGLEAGLEAARTTLREKGLKNEEVERAREEVWGPLLLVVILLAETFTRPALTLPELAALWGLHALLRQAGWPSEVTAPPSELYAACGVTIRETEEGHKELDWSEAREIEAAL